MKKTTWITFAILALLILSASVIYVYQNQRETERITNDSSISDAEKFRREYPDAAENNRYIYATASEAISVLKEGSGIVYLGFPECPWCQALVPMMDEAAEAEGLDKIHYLNIRQIREDGNEDYQKLVEALREHLDEDEDGQPRIYVPDVTATKDGQIVGHFMQETGGPDERTPDTYWTDERRAAAVEQLRQMMSQTKDS